LIVIFLFRTPRSRIPPFYDANYSPDGFDIGRMHKTAHAQRLIWQHQNPADCSNAVFVRIDLPLSGMGSLVHQVGAYIALAMNTGRVLVLADQAFSHWGMEDARNGHETFFMPLTHCNLTKNSHIEDVRGADVVNVMPANFSSILDSAPVSMPDTPKREMKYWVRAQMSAYIMRLNERTSNFLKQNRLAPCEWTMHVRRGEKAREMVLRPVSKFLAALPRRAKTCVLLNTEDPTVLESMRAALGKRLRYVQRDRSNADFSSSMNDTLMDLLSLWSSLEATHFVGTLGSNWDRLVDELRRIWAAPAPGCCTDFIEVGCAEEVCAVDTVNW